MTVSNPWWEIIILCNFPVSGGLLLEKWTIFDTYLTSRVPKKLKRVKNWNLSLTSDCLKYLMRNYVSMQICSFWGSLLIQFLINSSNFHSFWPQGCPQKVSKKVICLETSNLWWEILSLCKFAALVVIFRIGNFDPFCAQRSSGCPQNGQKKCCLTKIDAAIEFLMQNFLSMPNCSYRKW